MSEHGRVEGKAALVTGASSGLGRATAIALARAGADVALAARSKDELEGAKGEISELGRRALPLPLDLASETDTAEAVGRTFEAFGRIDILSTLLVPTLQAPSRSSPWRGGTAR
jgi:NADP-dependent 3-hydroxy acid dehydrogenase YdfG